MRSRTAWQRHLLTGLFGIFAAGFLLYSAGCAEQSATPTPVSPEKESKAR